jgi:hypothetical protein
LASFFFETTLLLCTFFNCFATSRRSFRISNAFRFNSVIFAAQLSGVKSATISAMVGVLRAVVSAALLPVAAGISGAAGMTSLPASMTGIVLIVSLLLLGAELRFSLTRYHDPMTHIRYATWPQTCRPFQSYIMWLSDLMAVTAG